jgi:hypothetical protein
MNREQKIESLAATLTEREITMLLRGLAKLMEPPCPFGRPAILKLQAILQESV